MYLEGVVTDWRPSQLEGQICLGEKGEVMTVRRQDFVPGGDQFYSLNHMKLMSYFKVLLVTLWDNL